MSAERFATEDPALCAVCRRSSVGLAYPINHNGETKLAWLCDDAVCHKVARKACNMPRKQLDYYETRAARAAIDEAGPYLDSIGKTDLATLTEVEIAEFCRVFITAFEMSMRAQFERIRK
jgi:hypothetical protein